MDWVESDTVTVEYNNKMPLGNKAYYTGTGSIESIPGVDREIKITATRTGLSNQVTDTVDGSITYVVRPLFDNRV